MANVDLTEMPPGDPTQYTMQRAFMGVVLAPPPSETQPPQTASVSPDPNEAPGSPGAFPTNYQTAKDTPIVRQVFDAENAVAFVVLTVLYADLGREASEVIYAGRPAVDAEDGFVAPYASLSSITGNGDPGVGFTFHIRHDTGWPGRGTLSSEIKLGVQAVDSKGNVLA